MPDLFEFVSTPLENEPEPPCTVTIDLDCDDSSGATDADYNSPDFDCLTEPGVGIADEDVNISIDDFISTMTITLIPTLPDDPNEILLMTGAVDDISVTGAGTTTITLTNEDSASMRDFIDALHLIFYDNTAELPTGGLRTVEVQFTTMAGTQSNVASAYINVLELPLVPVDLGPDTAICDGESFTFDAGNPGAYYAWNTGATTQTITVSDAGTYTVTVSDFVNCPGRDTVELDVLPVITLSLEGDTDICDDGQATLVIHTDAPFPVNVQVTPNPGTPFVLNNVLDGYTFSVNPIEGTEYTITDLSANFGACFTMEDSTQIVLVHATYYEEVTAEICAGDSVDLGGYWETLEGVYTNTFQSLDNCDSTVVTTILVEAVDSMFVSATTCDSAAVGVTTAYLDNPFGCDTVLLTTTTLAPGDTTQLQQTTCNQSEAGTFETHLQNQAGCDSLILTTVTYIPGGDTTHLTTQSCDTADVGTEETLLQNSAGCDSLIITTTILTPADTTQLHQTSCDTGAVGVFEELLSNQSGCDSLIITTVTYSESDSVWLTGVTCDLAEAGMTIESFVNQLGCDSIVTTTIVLLPSDSTYLHDTTCDSAEAGISVQTLANQYGCDSIVVTEVELVAMANIDIALTTCDPAEVGTETYILPNPSGCDTLVTETTVLAAADTTLFQSFTCDVTQVDTTTTLFNNTAGCDSLVIEAVALYPQPPIALIPTEDYNGYDISCAGEADGALLAEITGTGPFDLAWSTGETTAAIQNLAPGTYSLSITDGNGCTTEAEITLFAPPPLTLDLAITEPGCFDAGLGQITASPTGGAGTYTYTLNAEPPQQDNTFDNLSEGVYTLEVTDANNCSTSEIVWINVPLLPGVDLGTDTTITAGDTLILQAIVDVPFDSLLSITWTGLDNPDCPTCLEQPVAPVITTTYSITVLSVDGCPGEDALTVFVDEEHNIYAPNIFSPNGDGINDTWGLFGPGTAEMHDATLRIYNRWGGIVFLTDDFTNPNALWDGTTRNEREVTPDVFVWEVVFLDEEGNRQRLVGDVTLVR